MESIEIKSLIKGGLLTGLKKKWQTMEVIQCSIENGININFEPSQIDSVVIILSKI